MGTGRRVAIILAAMALMMSLAVPSAWASGGGKGSEKERTEQRGPAQHSSSESESGEQQAECPPPADPATPTDPAAGTTSTSQATVSTCEDRSGAQANVNLTGRGKAVEHNSNVDANGQLMPGTVGQSKSGTEADQSQVTTDAKARAEVQAKEHIARVKAESRGQAKAERQKGEHGAFLVYVDGQRLNVTPVERSGRTLVPFRRLAEFLGAKVTWEPSTQSITMVKGDTTVTLTIGSNTATVDGEQVEIQAAPELVEEHTFVPLRFIATALGADVDYEQETGAITVISVPAAPAPAPAPAPGSDGTTTGGTTTGTGN